MRAFLLLLASFALAGSSRTVLAQTEKPLDIQFIDVEGGQATLIVSPSGESLLVDTGYPGFNGRDADRIAAAVKQAGLSRIDYLIITHYHGDHVGGATALAARVPIRTFVDHGPDGGAGRPAGGAVQRVSRRRARRAGTCSPVPATRCRWPASTCASSPRRAT